MSSIPQHHLSSLLRKDYTTVDVKFSGSPKLLTYRARRDQLAGLVVGGRVIVPGVIKGDGSQSFSIAHVVEIHDKPKIDYSLEVKYAWIVAAVDFTIYEQIQEQEKLLEEKLLDVRREQEETAIRESLLGSVAPSERLVMEGWVGALTAPKAKAVVEDAVEKERPQAGGDMPGTPGHMGN